MQLDQLRTLQAIVVEGSFEGAALALHVTPSAVSQRIKALEAEVGRVLVRRSTPCEVTDAGAPLLRMARQVDLLEAEARSELGLAEGRRTIVSVAINADSLETWLKPLLHVAATWPDLSLHIEVEDQEHSVDNLRRGQVCGAVCVAPQPVSGCRVVPLGAMRYLPVAAPALRDAHRLGRSVDWSAMPVMQFNRKDDLQGAFLRDRGVETAPPTAQVPSPSGFYEAVRAGLGWGLVPELQLADDLRTGRLVRLDARRHVDVELAFQVWSLASEPVTRLTAAITDCARALRRGPAPRKNELHL